MINEKEITTQLRHIIDPMTGKDVVEAGLISSVVVRDGDVGLMITIEPHQREARAPLQQAITDHLMTLEGVRKVTPVMTAQTGAESPKPEASRGKAKWNLTPIQNVGRVIAVASGKGGVGKSTVTAALALALAQQGYRVGIVDADIYGPSIPGMLGLAGSGKPELDGQLMIPPVAGGVVCISVGLLLEGDQAAIMRGPMVSKSLHQLLRGTRWANDDAPLDLLLMDMPPGTGDVHLSMVQQVPLAYNGGGALIVTTPQEVALWDGRKCLKMFDKTHVPVKGVIENMSWFSDPGSGEKLRLFGEGGGETLAAESQAPLLGQLPLKPELREAADTGTLPDYIAAHPQPWGEIAAKLVVEEG